MTSEKFTTDNIKYTKKARHGHGKDVVDEDNVRQVAGCLPIDPLNRRFLFVSSRKNPGTWVIPKGGWEEDETQEHAAMRETWEEAGIKGRIIRHIGVFVERNKKSAEKAHHWIYELEIQEVAKKFPEKKKRERRWFTYEEALAATQHDYLRDAIRLSSLSPEANESTGKVTAPSLQQYTITPQGVSGYGMPPGTNSSGCLPPSPPDAPDASIIEDSNSSRKRLGAQIKSLLFNPKK